MFYLADYEAFITAVIENSGEDTKYWDVEGMALALRDRLNGEDPEEMDGAEFYSYLEEYQR